MVCNLALFNRFIIVFTFIYTYTAKKSPSRHVYVVSGNCIINRNAGSNFYQM